jgi:hypothetical protein
MGQGTVLAFLQYFSVGPGSVFGSELGNGLEWFRGLLGFILTVKPSPLSSGEPAPCVDTLGSSKFWSKSWYKLSILL